MKLTMIRRAGANYQQEKVDAILIDEAQSKNAEMGGDVIAVHYIISMPDTKTVNVSIVKSRSAKTGDDLKEFDKFEKENSISHQIAEGALKTIGSHKRTVENPTTHRACYALFVVEA